MKALLKIMSTVLLIAMLGVLFAACDDELPDKAPNALGKDQDYRNAALSTYLISDSNKQISFYFESNGDGTCILTACSVKKHSEEIDHVDFPATSPSGEKVVGINIIGSSDGNVPGMLTEERFAKLNSAIEANGISDFDKTKFLSHYTLIDIKKMTDSIDDAAEKEAKRQEILNKYPFAAIMSLYVLDGEVHPNDIKALSEIFTQMEYTRKDCIDDYNDILRKAIDTPKANNEMVRSIPRPYLSIWGHIKSVGIPEGVQSIEALGIANLTEFKLPESLTEIGANALYELYVDSIDIPESVTKIGRGAFSSCYEIRSITVPSGVTVLEAQTFALCRNLSKVSLSEGLTAIGSEAFLDCKKLKEINIPKSVNLIEINAFEGCSSLRQINYGGTKAEWVALISKTENINWNSGLVTEYDIVCTDGVISFAFDKG